MLDAKWITTPWKGTDAHFVLFRRKLILTTDPDFITIIVSSKTPFELYINCRCYSSNSDFKVGTTQTVQLQDCFTWGVNVIAVRVLTVLPNLVTNSLEANEIALYLEGSMHGNGFGTNESWYCTPCPDTKFSTTIQPSKLDTQSLAEMSQQSTTSTCESFVGDLAMDGWIGTVFDDSSWTPVAVLPTARLNDVDIKAGAANPSKLETRSLEIIHANSASNSIPSRWFPPQTKQVIVLCMKDPTMLSLQSPEPSNPNQLDIHSANSEPDTGTTVIGQLRLRTMGGAGAKINIRYEVNLQDLAEKCRPVGNHVVLANNLASDQAYQYTTFFAHRFRYVEISIAIAMQELKILGIDIVGDPRSDSR